MEKETEWIQQENKLLWMIWDAAQKDPLYAEMLSALKELEPKYEQVMRDLPEECKDILREYRSLCEEMSWRMLQLSCSF